MSKHTQKDRLDKFNEFRRNRGTGGGNQYPDRQYDVGSDVYVVRPNETWQSIAQTVYGSDRFASDIQDVNRGFTSLHPGMKLLLPDRRENPRVSVGNEDFWNTPEFANSINSIDEQRKLISGYRKAEQMWPEHGERVWVGFDENNDPFPTTDSQGMAMFWDQKENTWTFEDTGIGYSMGMMENDFIKPLSEEEKAELTLLAEQKFSPKAMSYYAEVAESGQFKADVADRMENINFRTTHPTDQESEFVPTLHGLPQAVPTKMRWWESALDSISNFEEGFRGISNVALREGEEGKEVFNIL